MRVSVERVPARKRRYVCHEPFPSSPMISCVFHIRRCLKLPQRGSYRPWAVTLCTMAVKTTHSSARLVFDLCEVSSSSCMLRRGRLSLKGREPINTPCYLPPSSRGCVPHITQDTVRSNTGIRGIYVALEDCECSKSDVKPRVCMSCANSLLLQPGKFWRRWMDRTCQSIIRLLRQSSLGYGNS